MAGLIAATYGVIAYGFMLGSMLYLIGFVGNFAVPKSVDSGAAGPVLQSLIVNTLLLAVFAIQHSVMARQGFKRWWIRVVPVSIERSTYVLFASLALLLLYWQWRPIPTPVWTMNNQVAVAVLLGIFWLGWIVAGASTFLLNHFELFGLSQVFARWFDKSSEETKFRTPSLYRHVRHPLYLGILLAVWATPVMSVGHLLFAAVFTLYTLAGIQFEERDLIRQFGDEYRSYQRHVGMLMPLPGRRSIDPKDTDG